MKVIEVTTKEQLDNLYNDWALTLEGFAPDEKNLAELLDWIKVYTPLKREDVYIIQGCVMNREYHLTGSNAYPEVYCTIACVKLDDMEHPEAVTMPRFMIGGRWFVDVVDNNARREEQKRMSAEY